MRTLLPRLLACAALFIGLAAHAQEIKFNASVDRTEAATGERVKLAIAVVNPPANNTYTPPDLGSLVVLEGPFNSTSIVDNNGRVARQVTITWMLTATQPGDYTIGAATLNVGKGNIRTQPIKLHFTRNANAPPSNAAVEQGQRGNANLFCVLGISKARSYVGEQLVASCTVYWRPQLALNLDKADWPKPNGFWTEDVSATNTNGRQVVNGVEYNTALLEKRLLIPQHAGRLTVSAFIGDFRINASFINRGTPMEVKSNTVEVNVLELPEPKPADFIGAVGELGMELKVGSTEVKANTAIDLKLAFSGHANLKLIDAPKLAFPSDFEAYDPKIEDHITITGGGMGGSREFQYLVVPRHEGDYDIGALTFSYFDPGSGQYKQLRSQALSFHVAKGDPGSASVSSPTHSDVQQLGQDIRYIHIGNLHLRLHGRHLFGSWPYVAGLLAPLVAFVALFIWYRNRRRALADVQGMRRKHADRVARERLKAAAAALKADDRSGFYDALGKALEGYFADKFDLGVAQVSAATVQEKLGHLENGAVARAYSALLDDCGMARFAPFENKPRQQSYDEAAALIGRIEEQLRA